MIEDLEEKSLQKWEDEEVFEATRFREVALILGLGASWRRSAGWKSSGRALYRPTKLHGSFLSQDLDAFGRQEPKMCATVKVTVPALTLHDSSPRLLEARINATLEALRVDSSTSYDVI